MLTESRSYESERLKRNIRQWLFNYQILEYEKNKTPTTVDVKLGKLFVK